MPAIRGIYGNRPSDNAQGLWIERSKDTTNVVVGWTTTQINSFVAGRTQAQLQAFLTTQLQVLIDSGDPGTMVVTIVVLTMSPLTYSVTVSNP